MVIEKRDFYAHWPSLIVSFRPITSRLTHVFNLFLSGRLLPLKAHSKKTASFRSTTHLIHQFGLFTPLSLGSLQLRSRPSLSRFRTTNLYSRREVSGMVPLRSQTRAQRRSNIFGLSGVTWCLLSIFWLLAEVPLVLVCSIHYFKHSLGTNWAI